MVQALSIRTKLIMAMLALVASVALMGMTADDANAAGVTEIRWVENHTRYYVYIKNHESGAKKLIAPYSAVSYNQWVPWATSAYDFDRDKYIEIGWAGWPPPYEPHCSIAIECPQLAIWQEARNTKPFPGDAIRYTRATGWTFSYDPSAPPMPGASNTGGRRNLIIRSDTIDARGGCDHESQSLLLDQLAAAREGNPGCRAGLGAHQVQPPPARFPKGHTDSAHIPPS